MNLKIFDSPYVTQVLGYCFEGENSVMIAELAPYGDLKDFVTSQEKLKMLIIINKNIGYWSLFELVTVTVGIFFNL